MPGNISGFKWGTGEENLLLFDYPFDNVRYYRKSRPGRSRVRIPGAGYDTWSKPADFMVEADIRWLSMAKWSDPVGVQAFLDYAGDDGTFSFLPDATVPDFSIPNCFLESPFESPDPGTEQSGEQIVRIVFGNPTINLAQAMRGIMFEYAPGASLTDPVAATFTRATPARRVGKDLGIYEDASGVLRDRHYEGALRTALLEGARINALDNGSADTDTAGWTSNGLTSLTRVTTDSPAFGAGHMQAVVPNSSGVGPFVVLRSGANVAASVGQLWSGAIRAKTNSSGPVSYHLRLDWYDSTPTFLSSTTAVISIDGTYRRFSVRGTAPANTAVVQLVCYTNGAQGVHTVWFDLAQLEQAAFESSDIPTNTATVARDPDLFTWPFTFPLQDIFIFAEIARPVWAGLSGVGFPGLITIGDASTSTLEIYSDGINLSAEIRGVLNRTAAQSIPAGNLVACAQFKGFPNAAQVALDVGPGPGSFSATTVLAALANPRLRLGWSGSNIQGLFGGLERVKIGPRIFRGVTRDTVAKARAA